MPAPTERKQRRTSPALLVREPSDHSGRAEDLCHRDGFSTMIYTHVLVSAGDRSLRRPGTEPMTAEALNFRKDRIDRPRRVSLIVKPDPSKASSERTTTVRKTPT